MTITRENRRGLRYQLTPAGKDTIAVLQTRPPKTVLLNATLDEVNKAWFKWQMDGLHIQDAFPFLNADQREFLLTGITPLEWREIFKGDE